MMFRKKPSFWSVLAIYNPNSNGLLIAILVVAMGGIGFITDHRFDVQIMVTTALFLILFLLFLYARQYKILSGIFINGVETTGVVVDTYFWLGMGYITCEYFYSDRKYRSTERIRKTRKSKELSIGQKIILFVNRENPLQAFVRGLYL
jgi:hypothetical protein